MLSIVSVRLFYSTEVEKYKDFVYDYTFWPHRGIEMLKNKELALNSQIHIEKIDAHDE